MTEARDEEKAALEQVIRSFSDAEVALQEIAAESLRIRSATHQLATAEAALVGSNAAVGELAASVADAAERLQDSASALKSAAQRLAELDPPRIHAQLIALHNDVEASTRSIGVALVKAAEESRTDRSRLASEQASRSDGMKGALDELGERLTRQGRQVIVVLVLALIAAAASVYGLVAP